MAWGETYLTQALAAIAGSDLPPLPILIVTDEETPAPTDLPERAALLRAPLQGKGKARKCEMFRWLPRDFDSLLFLDVDTRVLGDVSLGFEKAERHGIAIAQATHYSLEDFRDFRKVMIAEGVQPRGQLVYNSGVVFFAPGRKDVRTVFAYSEALARRWPDAPWGDQTYLTLAMEFLGFNPYTLSTSFNHRGFGELISGQLRIWHSYQPLPEGARSLEAGWLHRCEAGRIVRAMAVPK